MLLKEKKAQESPGGRGWKRKLSFNRPGQRCQVDCKSEDRYLTLSPVNCNSELQVAFITLFF